MCQTTLDVGIGNINQLQAEDARQCWSLKVNCQTKLDFKNELSNDVDFKNKLLDKN